MSAVLSLRTHTLRDARFPRQDDALDAAGGALAGVNVSAANGAGASPSAAAGSSTPGKNLAAKSAAAVAATAGGTTLKRQLSSDRERVQNFLAQRTGGGAVGGGGSGGSGGAAVGAKPALSAVERAKLLMAKKAVVTSRPGVAAAGNGGSAAVKRTNPLTDILKGGSGSVVGGMHNVKRPRTKSDKPGEIKINGGRSAIQVRLAIIVLAAVSLSRLTRACACVREAAAGELHPQ